MSGHVLVGNVLRCDRLEITVVMLVQFLTDATLIVSTNVNQTKWCQNLFSWHKQVISQNISISSFKLKITNGIQY